MYLTVKQQVKYLSKEDYKSIKQLIVLFSLILLTLVLCSCGEQLQKTTVGTVNSASAVVEQENKDSADKQQVYDDVLNSVN